MAFNNRGGGGQRGGSRRGGGGRSNQPRREFVFHDALVASSPIRVKVDNEPRWLEAKQNYIVDLTIYDPEGGPASELTYWAENADCGEFFDDKVGQTFTIIAEGGGKGRKETGLITYVGESGTPAQETPPPRSQQRQTDASPAGAAAPTQRSPKSGANSPTHADIVKNTLEALKTMGRQGSVLQLAAQQTLKEVEMFVTSFGFKVTPEQRNEFVLLIARNMTAGTFSTLFIEFNKVAGKTSGLPTKEVLSVIAQARERKAKGEPAVPEEKPAPKPKCPKHGVEMGADGQCPKCIEEAKLVPDDDVPF